MKVCIFLKGTLCWIIYLLILAACKANNPIADLKAGDGLPNFHDLTGDTCAENEWVVKPGEHEVALLLYFPVDWVDSYCGVLD